MESLVELRNVVNRILQSWLGETGREIKDGRLVGGGILTDLNAKIADLYSLDPDTLPTEIVRVDRYVEKVSQMIAESQV